MSLLEEFDRKRYDRDMRLKINFQDGKYRVRIFLPDIHEDYSGKNGLKIVDFSHSKLQYTLLEAEHKMKEWFLHNEGFY